ncbi:MAG: ATP-grasp domain-containing protein [Dehalococcoidia bacterium]|nr:ATP-grasp domain-containing protein [Dehalococcoidia bacterium]
MRPAIAVIYNQPGHGRYSAMGEDRAELSVLDAAQAVEKALVRRGCPAVRVPLSPPLGGVLDQLKAIRADLVFNLFEGFDGSPETEAAVASLLSDLGFRYTGSPGPALALALDKYRTQQTLERAHIPTPACQVLGPNGIHSFCLKFPCIVKPCREDASHGLSEESVVAGFPELEERVKRISRLFGDRALIEEYVDGRELNVTVIGREEPVALPLSEIVYTLPEGMPRILTFAAKWVPTSLYFKNTKSVCPAEIESELHTRIVNIAVTAFKLLGCSGYARVDFRLDADKGPLVIDVNPNPDISPDSGAALQAGAAGIEYEEFVERIALQALGQA